MKRRDTIKTIVAGSIGTGLIISGCDPSASDETVNAVQTRQKMSYGRTALEEQVDKELAATPFFNEHEMLTISVLADLVIPADNRSGSATEAGVPGFIDFMMKDHPPFQLPVRGGLMWLDHPGFEQGVSFFNIVRNLTATGFFTSETGIRDLDYQGNVPNFWDGVPPEVLAEHGLEYDDRWINKYVRPEDTGTIPQWDEHGNITG